MQSDVNTEGVENSNDTSEDPKDVDGHVALIADLKDQRETIKQGGGPKRIEAQHAKGNLTAREPIVRQLDEGSIQEIDAFVTHRHRDFGM